MLRETLIAIALASTSAACQDSLVDGPVDAGAQVELESRGRIVVVPLALGTELSAELSRSTPSFLFSFELSAPARVSLHTRAGDAGTVVDTVLTLSRIDQYGLPRLVGTSDDFDHTPFSGLDRTLSKGEYRTSVRGATLRTSGPFVLTSSCTGSGCPALPVVCLFGEQFADLHTSALLQVGSEEWLTSEAQLTSALMRDQVVLAVQQSAHTDVTTPAAALAAVDQNQIRHLEVAELSGSRAFTVYEYGAGDNSYGAIFEQGTLTIAAGIHDGDLVNCDVSP